MDKVQKKENASLEELVAEMEKVSDVRARELSRALVQGVMDLHRQALEKLCESMNSAGTALPNDPAVNSVLLLHDLHPSDLQTRVSQALQGVRPALQSHRGNVELLSVSSEGVVQLRLQGACESCSSAPATLRNLIEEAIHAYAPDVVSIQIAKSPEISKPVLSGDQCDMCASPMNELHSHLFDVQLRKVFCACQACSLLFSDDGRTKYRRIPEQVEQYQNFVLNEEKWLALGVPVKMAFLFKSSIDQSVMAIYPSPGGVIESVIPAEAWGEIQNDNPQLSGLKPDVEALLIHQAGAVREFFRAPIDQCFSLVGLLRRHWTGFSGGPEVQEKIGSFFNNLREKAYEF